MTFLAPRFCSPCRGAAPIIIISFMCIMASGEVGGG
jgi:hypothetical protein